MIWISLLSKS